MSETKCERCAELVAELEQERGWHYGQSDKAAAAEKVIERLKAGNASLLESLRAWKEGVCQNCVDREPFLAAAEQRNTELEGALRKIARLPMSVIEEASQWRASVDWARVCKWIQSEADAALRDEERSAPPQGEEK